MRRSVHLVLLAACGLAGCAYDDHGHGYRTQWVVSGIPYQGSLSGPGLATLDDWLKDTREGNLVVIMGFSEAHRGVVSEDVAHRANIWFRRYADRDRDMTITDAEIRTALVAAAGRWADRPGPSARPGN